VSLARLERIKHGDRHGDLPLHEGATESLRDGIEFAGEVAVAEQLDGVFAARRVGCPWRRSTPAAPSQSPWNSAMAASCSKCPRL